MGLSFSSRGVGKRNFKNIMMLLSMKQFPVKHVVKISGNNYLDTGFKDIIVRVGAQVKSGSFRKSAS